MVGLVQSMGFSFTASFYFLLLLKGARLVKNSYLTKELHVNEKCGEKRRRYDTMESITY